MFCANCGTADQTADSYCRKCGEFLIAASSKFDLVSKFFGVNTPEKQININLVINLAGAILSAFLLVFLIGYFDAGANRNPPIETPAIAYLVEAFLLFIAVWQFLGFILAINFKSKFSNRNQRLEQTLSEPKENVLPAAETRDLLPSADLEIIVPPSAVENTTRKLSKQARK